MNCFSHLTWSKPHLTWYLYCEIKLSSKVKSVVPLNKTLNLLLYLRSVHKVHKVQCCSQGLSCYVFTAHESAEKEYSCSIGPFFGWVMVKREKICTLTEAISLKRLAQTQKGRTAGLFLSAKSAVLSHYPSALTSLLDNCALGQVASWENPIKFRFVWKTSGVELGANPPSVILQEKDHQWLVWHCRKHFDNNAWVQMRGLKHFFFFLYLNLSCYFV